MALKKIDELIQLAKEGETRRISVAAAADRAVLSAINDAMQQGIVKPVLVGDEGLIREIANDIHMPLDDVRIEHEADDAQACRKAVALIKNGEAEVLMKGLVATVMILKAVLDKENGLRKGSTLSHFALFESPYYHKLIGITDAAMNVAPEFQDKVAIVKNAVEAMRGVGVERPRVAILGPLETINPKIESTVHGAMLSMMNRRNQIKNCIIDGPLAFDNAISKEACTHKKIQSEVGGEADILVAPDLNAANILYKNMAFMGGAVSAAVITGAACPIVLTSRADTERIKLLSIAFAAAMC